MIDAVIKAAKDLGEVLHCCYKAAESKDLKHRLCLANSIEELLQALGCSVSVLVAPLGSGLDKKLSRPSMCCSWTRPPKYGKDAECPTTRQVQLANAFCRYFELADQINA